MDQRYAANRASLNQLLIRNPHLISTAQLTDPQFSRSIDWSEIDRDSLNDALRAIARLAPIEADPRRAYALVNKGYDSADRIARAGASAFLRDVTPEIDARAAWLAFNRAHTVRSRTVHQWLRIREALSPYQRARCPLPVMQRQTV